MEIAHWINCDIDRVPRDAPRVYLGHETCIDQIPTLHDIIVISHQLRDANRQMTLVTPFLTEKGMERVCKLIESVSELLDCFEVVCNDWGLLHWLTECQIGEATIGRFLVGQATDPRLAAFDLPEKQLPYERSVLHANGTRVRLRYRRPTDALMSHLRDCALDIPEVLSFLRQLGVRRLEISNVMQGVQMRLASGWRVSLHLPEVPVTVARYHWRDSGTEWLHPTFPVALQQRDNIIYYRNSNKPRDLHSLRIDRLVHRV